MYIPLPRNQSYHLPKPHVKPDALVAAALLKLARRGAASVNDFGAGVGQYGRTLLSLDPKVRYRAYDGAGDVWASTAGFVHWFDLTRPLSLPRADWVLSLEVGEHIPAEREAVVLRNIHAHNCRGVILSWAELGQAGTHHVNNHGAPYLIQRFTDLGYRLDVAQTMLLRGTPGQRWDGNSSVGRRARRADLSLAWPLRRLATVGIRQVYDWFQRTLLVFERRTPPAGCRSDF